jgi:hypothetical protein
MAGACIKTRVCSHVLGACINTRLLTWLVPASRYVFAYMAVPASRYVFAYMCLVPASRYVFAHMAGACIKSRVCLHGWCLHQDTCMLTWLVPASNHVFVHMADACIKIRVCSRGWCLHQDVCFAHITWHKDTVEQGTITMRCCEKGPARSGGIYTQFKCKLLLSCAAAVAQ